MRSSKMLWLVGFCAVLLLLGSGQGCPMDVIDNSGGGDSSGTGDSTDDSDSTDGSTDGSTDDGDSGDSAASGQTIAVTFILSAKVVTSIGSGVDGEAVNFVADKYLWDAFEEDWVFKRTMNATRTTNSAGEPGTTDTWTFGYNLHDNEKVFITVTLPSSGAKAETSYSYTQAAAGGGETASYVYQATLDSGI